MIKNYYKGTNGVFIVYGITNIESFDSIDYLFKKLKEQTDVEIILIGNKFDLSKERKIEQDIGKAKAESLNTSFFEVSVQDNINIKNVFHTLFINIYEKHINDEDNDSFDLALNFAGEKEEEI